MNECSIVKDLLPLYADDLASPDSAEFIARHTAWCPDCREILQRVSEKLPDVDPMEEAKNFKKGLRRAKRRMFLKSMCLCLIAVAIGGFFLAYQLYAIGYYPVTVGYPSPDGQIILEVVEKEDAPIFYDGEGLMVRFNLKNSDGKLGGLNRHPTEWDSLTAHWAQDSCHVLLDVVTREGRQALFVTDASLGYRMDGLIEIPGITEDLVPVLEEQLRVSYDFDCVAFTFESWKPNTKMVILTFATDLGASGRIAYEYSTGGVWEMAEG